MLIDANCWGALSSAETTAIPRLVFSPFIPYLDSPGSPPFGPGFAPRTGWVGRVRDAGVTTVTRAVFDGPVRRGLAPVRAALGLPAVRSADDLMRRAPAILVATAKPFEYPHTAWGDSVHLIGPAIFEPPSPHPPGWLDDIERPVVLVTTSSVRQADTALVRTALRALDGETVHVVATLPAGTAGIGDYAHRHANVTGFVPHAAVLDRAVCVVTHGGMGITQKALSRGIPVCAVPFGRDQFEVARRVELARCGTRLPARHLTASRLRDAVVAAMTMSAGARAVAAGFEAAGGMRHGANLVEQQCAARRQPVPAIEGLSSPRGGDGRLLICRRRAAIASVYQAVSIRQAEARSTDVHPTSTSWDHRWGRWLGGVTSRRRLGCPRCSHAARSADARTCPGGSGRAGVDRGPTAFSRHRG